MIRLKGRLICMSLEEAATVRWNLPAHELASRAEPGCLQFEVTPTDDPLIFDVLESFRTRADFDAHQARTRQSPWFEATRPILRDYRVEELMD